MSQALKLALLCALRRILEPLARLAIDAGIGVGEFHSLTKVAFVKAADDVSRKAGKANVSAIALLTGLRRVEAKSLLGVDESVVPEPERHRHRAERVLAGWWTDADYVDPAGRPLALRVNGPAPSFESLARKYSGEPRIRALRTELLRAKAITRLPDGSLQAVSRTFATARWEPDSVALIGERVREHLLTLVHNLRHPARPRYARTISTDNLNPEYLPMLVRDLTRAADTMADGMDDALHSPQAAMPEGEAGARARLGLSLVVFEDPVPYPEPREPSLATDADAGLALPRGVEDRPRPTPASAKRRSTRRATR